MPHELNTPLSIAALWIGLALVASLISIRVGISVALAETLIGVVAGNAFQLNSNECVTFLAGFTSAILTFVARTKVEPESCGAD